MKKETLDESKPQKGSRFWREVLSWFWVILAFLFIQGTLVQARVIPSGSMESTVLIGDHLLMSRIGYEAGVPFTSWHWRLWRAPKRGQIMVFRAPVPGSPDFIKRLIGLPGDTIEIRDGAVWLNGKRQNEPYINEPMDMQSSCDFGCGKPVTVPPHSYFMMGDNRNNSKDSRSWGFAPDDSIEGTPIILYMSIDAPGDSWEPGHIPDRVRAYWNAVIHPSTVRWKRLFRIF
jgi:signal peptidase I